MTLKFLHANYLTNKLLAIFGVFCKVLLGWCCLFASHLAAVELTSATQTNNLYHSSTYYLDESGSMPFESVVQQTFSQPSLDQNTNYSFGYSDANVWIRFELINYTEQENWLVEVGYPILDEAEFFVLFKDGRVSHYQVGDHFAFSDRPYKHRNFLFPIELNRQESATVYLRVKSSSSLRVPLSLWSEKHYFEEDQNRVVTQGLYFGILLIMMLYNLFIYWSIKEQAYLHYVFYVGSYIIVQASLNGFLSQFFFSLPPVILDKAVVLSLSLVILFGCSFSLKFLNLRYNHLNAHRVLALVGLLGGLTFLFAFILPYSISILITLILAVTGSLLITFFGFILWTRNGIREARFFTIAWVGFLLGSVMTMLSRMHLFPDNFFTANAAQIGSAFEVTLLSFALADKFSQMRNETEKVELNAKDSLSKVNTLLTETLSRLQKSNQIKSEFLATVSHELRTPMNGVVAANELMRTAKLDKECLEYIDISETSSRKMMQLIDSILQFVDLQAQQSDVKREHIAVDCLFADLQQLSAEFLGNKKLNLSFDIPENFNMEVNSDYQKLMQILKELIDNACKFTSRGQISVSVEVSEKETISEVMFVVRDTGIGIQEKNLKRIFEPFFIVDSSSKRRYGGIGMGLTTAQALAFVLGGTIKVESSFGKGSQFTLSIPHYNLGD